VNGLLFQENFISDDEEVSLVSFINQFKKDNPKSVANYGSNNYGSIYFGERYKKEKFIFPEQLLGLSNKLIHANLITELPFGIAINEYKKGQKIGPHIDKDISGPIVTILSLGSISTMVFKKKNEEDIILDLTRKSIIQIKDEIRYEWTHEILPVPSLRYSIIFRSLC
jgi:alkylated DNA repair dioxygenase AlkB